MDPWWISYFAGMAFMALIIVGAVVKSRFSSPVLLASPKDQERRRKTAEKKTSLVGSLSFVLLIAFFVTMLSTFPTINITASLLGIFTPFVVLLIMIFVRYRYSHRVGFNLIERINDTSQVADVMRETENEIFAKGENAQRLNLMGVCLYKLDRYEEALEAYRRACDLQPTTHHKLGFAMAMWKLGKKMEAEAIFAEIATKPDATLIVFCEYAKSLAELGRVDDARAQLAKAEELLEPYAEKKIASRIGWTRLIDETRQAVTKAENREAGERAS